MSIVNPLPNNLINGTVDDATPVMANFNAIVANVNANAVANIGGTLTSPTINTPTLNGAGGLLTLPAGPDTLAGFAVLANTTDVTEGASLVTYIPAGAGAVAVSLRTKLLRREVDVEDYGDTSTAAGTLTAFNQALATGKVVRAQAPAYTLSGPLVLTANMKLQGAGLNKTTLTFQNTDGIKFTSSTANDGYLDLAGFTVSTTATTANNTTKGMNLTDVNYSRFEDIAVKYHQKGWYLQRGNAGANGCFFNKIKDTFAHSNQIGYEINDAVTDTDCNANIIINPHVEGNYIWPAQIGYAIAGYGIKVYNPYAGGLQNNAQAVTSITSAATTATVTQAAHGYSTGDFITVYGANQTGYNGMFQITKVDANTYTYTVASGLTTPATGTIKAASLSQISAFMLFSQGSPSALTASRIASLTVVGPYIESTPIWGFCIPNTTSARYGNTIISPQFDGGAGLAGNFCDPQKELNVIGPDFNQLVNTTTVTHGNMQVNSTNNGYANREGNNAKQGVAVLAAGTITVSTISVTATSRIFVSVQVPGGGRGILDTGTRVVGTSFQINSTNNTETSTVAWEIKEVAL